MKCNEEKERPSFITFYLVKNPIGKLYKIIELFVSTRWNHNVHKKIIKSYQMLSSIELKLPVAIILLVFENSLSRFVVIFNWHIQKFSAVLNTRLRVFIQKQRYIENISELSSTNWLMFDAIGCKYLSFTFLLEQSMNEF